MSVHIQRYRLSHQSRLCNPDEQIDVLSLAPMKLERLKGIVHSDSEIMGGTPVFVGTRVPLQNLIDCLEGGESVDEFLVGYPTVKREQAIAVLNNNTH